MPSDILKDGMVVWKGIDPREGCYCYYKYSSKRLESGNRSLCFESNRTVFEKLGLRIGPHWAKEDWLSVTGLKFYGPTSKDAYDLIEVHPAVEAFLKGGLTNKALKNLLSMEEI